MTDIPSLPRWPNKLPPFWVLTTASTLPGGGKAETASHVLQRTLAKLCQKASETWVSLLPVVLLRTRMAPEEILKLSLLDMTDGRPFFPSDLLFDEEAPKLDAHTVQLKPSSKGPPRVQKQSAAPTPTKEKGRGLHPVRGLCPTKNLEGRAPWGQATATMKGTGSSVTKQSNCCQAMRVTSWVRLSRIKSV